MANYFVYLLHKLKGLDKDGYVFLKHYDAARRLIAKGYPYQWYVDSIYYLWGKKFSKDYIVELTKGSWILAVVEPSREQAVKVIIEVQKQIRIIDASQTTVP